MKLKLTPEGHAVVLDGKPVYVHDDGKEIAFDAPGTVARISQLNGEAQGHRQAKEAAETKLKAFEGITDPAAALKAIETVRNLGDKQLVDAGKVEEVRAAAVREYEERLTAANRTHTELLTAEQKRAQGLEAALISEKIGGSFSRSKFISDKIAIPTDLVQARFGANFSLEDGKIVAKDGAGNRIYSRARPGDPNPDFDEALEILVDGYSQKASILKGTGASGGGAGASAGRETGGKKTYTRAAYDALPPAGQAAAAKEVATGTAVLTD